MPDSFICRLILSGSILDVYISIGDLNDHPPTFVGAVNTNVNIDEVFDFVLCELFCKQVVNAWYFSLNSPSNLRISEVLFMRLVEVILKCNKDAIALLSDLIEYLPLISELIHILWNRSRTYPF